MIGVRLKYNNELTVRYSGRQNCERHANFYFIVTCDCFFVVNVCLYVNDCSLKNMVLLDSYVLLSKKGIFCNNIIVKSCAKLQYVRHVVIFITRLYWPILAMLYWREVVKFLITFLFVQRL